MNEIWVLSGYVEDGYGGPGSSRMIGFYSSQHEGHAALEAFKALSKRSGGLQIEGQREEFDDFELQPLRHGSALEVLGAEP